MKVVIEKIIFISVIFLITDFLYSQEKDVFKDLLIAFDHNNLVQVDKELKKIDTTTITKYDKAVWLYYYSDLNYKLDNHDISYKNLLISSEQFKKLSKNKDVIDCYLLILSVLSHQKNINIDVSNIITKIENYALENNDSIALRRIYHRIASNFVKTQNQSEAIKYYRKIIPIVSKLKDCVRIGYCYENIGTSFQTIPPKNIDSARFYTRKATPFYIKYKKLNILAYNFNNRAEQLKLLGNYKKALSYYKKADSLPLDRHKSKTKLIFYENIADTYRKMKDYENENLYLRKYNKLKDSINDNAQNIAIADLDKKYKTAEKEKQILVEQQKKKQNRNLFLGTLAFLCLGGIIAYLNLKNSRKKRLLAEQQKEIEKQKNLTLLKEQEINTINAMVEGQEKERIRIAEDLHDNIGSVLATLKLHFENLKLNREKKHFNQEELYDKTEKLIDETYLKVRSIAHAKNAGVIANQGLLVAVKMMTEKISAAHQLHIQIIDFGLEKRLDTNTEITIFRIIQELTTNIIKHAEAKEATINISHFENTLNIIVEDDGKGFDKDNVEFNTGMGLGSIKKRVNHLDGTFQIDSMPDRGTTIIINIPV
ncbi:tetratricopeptide repeat-containing sensor histidine kinase [Tenacibaculum agarivorans]|uniref:tetratricopeptide repeat-containing sensor histidine kinase n=1 Tax=Tenacibaculum agarivorans TaxID=1908389 RepID=UPI00094BB049|nr:sensor histidine kinase [Tenacibaculum agarivorans]